MAYTLFDPAIPIQFEFCDSSIRRSADLSTTLAFPFEVPKISRGSPRTAPSLNVNCLTRGQRQDVSIQTAGNPSIPDSPSHHRCSPVRITSLADCRFDISHSSGTSSSLSSTSLYHLYIQTRRRAELIYPDRSFARSRDVVVSSCLLQVWQHRPLRWFVIPRIYLNQIRLVL